MGAITDEMRRLVEAQQLGFIATVTPDGTPNLSPKGTTAVLDDDHLVFADVRSPRTVANLRANPAIEINVVDVLTRKGFRFRGEARIVDDGDEFERLADFYRRRGSTSVKRSFVVMKVAKAAPLISPAYDGGASEADITARWRAYWDRLWDAMSER
jgi:predicted pyridoxine 5'-phosphate oxidase superfamily flavin-nucleotide-binding protein